MVRNEDAAEAGGEQKIGTTHLFQYGSNMSERVLRSKIEMHFARFAPVGTPLNLELLGPARLGGWRFVFGLYSATSGCRVADIVEGDGGAEVWGALYELPVQLVRRSDGARSVLDRIEGHRTSSDPENYEPVRPTVEFRDRLVEAWTYVGLPEARQRCRRDHSDTSTSAAYGRAILDGAADLPVPSGYFTQLREAVEAESCGSADQDHSASPD
jgi:hypothetical protein